MYKLARGATLIPNESAFYVLQTGFYSQNTLLHLVVKPNIYPSTKLSLPARDRSNADFKISGSLSKLNLQPNPFLQTTSVVSHNSVQCAFVGSEERFLRKSTES